MGGNDVINGRGQWGAGLHYLGPLHIEGGDGDDGLLRGSSSPTLSWAVPETTAEGQDGADVVEGGSGDDSQTGGGGDDSITGARKRRPGRERWRRHPLCE